VWPDFTVTTQGQYVWFNHPEETWSPAKVLEGGNEDISIEMVDGGLVRPNAFCVSPCRRVQCRENHARGRILTPSQTWQRRRHSSS
jgi:hypothetical protein